MALIEVCPCESTVVNMVLPVTPGRLLVTSVESGLTVVSNSAVALVLDDDVLAGTADGSVLPGAAVKLRPPEDWACAEVDEVRGGGVCDDAPGEGA